MASVYRVEAEIDKNIKTKEDMIKFFKKILQLKEFVEESNFECFEDDDTISVDGSIVLSKNKFGSLYKSASEIKWGHNAEFYQDSAKKYRMNFSVTKWKEWGVIRIVLEDISSEFYHKHSFRTVFFGKMIIGWYSNREKRFLFKIPYYYLVLNLPQPSFLKNTKEIRLPFISINFDIFDRINKYVEENNRVFVEFIKKFVELYNVDTCVGKDYSTVSMEGAIIFDYSKKNGFVVHDHTLLF
ncbi:MAG: hypothetical protein HYW26_04195 [Candidatus Aenigmarchaeota archaeon]|nr:hypothetical protein [Candidatus Aenigmarchaeota archaeon]